MATKPSPSADKAPETPGVNICPVDSVFNCTTEGLAMTGDGHARMYSALDGIQTIAAILFQREMDNSMEGGIVVDQKVAMGLLNALGGCTELAQYLLEGKGGYSRSIGTSEPDYAALQSLVTGRPG